MNSLPEAVVDERLRAIPGAPPDPGRLPPGCAFAPRCELAVDACRAAPIGLSETAPGHWSRCIRTDHLDEMRRSLAGGGFGAGVDVVRSRTSLFNRSPRSDRPRIFKHCSSSDDCPHVILRFRDAHQVSWQYTHSELGIDSYRSDPGLKLTSAILGTLHQYYKMEPA